MTEDHRQSYGVAFEADAPATRWIDMTSEEIATMAHHQIAGDFGPESDAITALHLIEALAHRLKEHSAAIAISLAGQPS